MRLATCWCAVLVAVQPVTVCGSEEVIPAPAPAVGQRLFQREFSSYTVMLLTPLDQPWQAWWNDAAQMAVFRHATNQAVITTQFLQFPLDADLQTAVGDRSRFLELALRKYCALQLARSPARQSNGNPCDSASGNSVAISFAMSACAATMRVGRGAVFST